MENSKVLHNVLKDIGQYQHKRGELMFFSSIAPSCGLSWVKDHLMVCCTCDLQIPTTPQMAAREKRVNQLTERVNKLVEEVSVLRLLLRPF